MRTAERARRARRRVLLLPVLVVAPLLFPGSGAPALATPASSRFELCTPGSTCNLGPDGVRVDGPQGPSSEPDPTFTISSIISSARPAQCRVLRSGLPLRAWADCGPTYPLGLTNEERDGSYVVQARVAGGRPVSSLPYVYDTTPPGPPQVSGPAGPSRDRAPGWTWEAEPGTTARCSLVHSLGGGVESETEPAGTPCRPGSTPEPSADGPVALEVRSVDVAGNESAPARSPDYVLDSTAPAAPALAVAGTGRRPLVNVSLEPGADAQCRLVDSAARVITDWTGCPMPWRPDLTGLPTGRYGLQVRQTDAAGNEGPAGDSTYVVDDAPAPRADVLALGSPSSDPVASFAVTVPAGVTASCRFAGPEGQLGTVLPCPEHPAYDIAGLPDGLYSLQVVATDAAGDTSPPVSAFWQLDRTPPTPVRFTEQPALRGSADQLHWAWPAEPGVSYSCTVIAPDGVVDVDAAPCGADLLVSADSRPAGQWTLTVTGRDAAGLISAASSGPVVDGDSPALSVSAPAPGSAEQPVWTVSSPGAPAQCTLRGPDGPDVIQLSRPCAGTYAADLAGQPDGAYELLVQADTATAVSSYRLDRVAPHLRLTAPDRRSEGDAENGLSTADRLPVLALGGDEPTDVSCRVVQGGQVLTDWSACSAPLTAGPLPVDLRTAMDGDLTVEVAGADLAGNRAYAALHLPLDTTPPAAPGVVDPPVDAGAFPSWRLTAAPGDRLVCTLRAPDSTSVPVSCEGDSFTTGPLATAGPWLLSVREIDGAGNLGPAEVGSYRYDPDPPTLGELVPGQAAAGAQRTARWSWSAEPGAHVRCTVRRDGGPVALLPSSCDSSAVLVVPAGAPDGVYELTVVAQDAAGGSSPPRTGTYRLDTAPPAAPLVGQAPASPSATTTVEWTVDAEPGTGLSCQLLGARSGPLRPLEPERLCDGTQSVDLEALGVGPGRYVLRTWAVDATGNRSAAGDTPVHTYEPSGLPAVSWSSGPSGVLSAVPRAGWVFRSDVGAELSCTLLLDGAVLAPRQVCDGSYGTAAMRRSGRYTLRVSVRDHGRTTEVPAQRSVVLDLTDPAEPTVRSTLPRAGTSPTATWTWTAERGATAECRLVPAAADAPEWDDCTPLDGTYSGTLPAEGAWRLQLRVTDAAGRRSPVVSSAVYTYDRTPPARPQVQAQVARSQEDEEEAPAARWTFTTPAGATAACTVALDGAVELRSARCSGAVALDLTDRRAGTYRLVVVATDAAGNSSRADADLLVAPPAPGPGLGGPTTAPTARPVPSSDLPVRPGQPGPVGSAPADPQGPAPQGEPEPLGPGRQGAALAHSVPARSGVVAPLAAAPPAAATNRQSAAEGPRLAAPLGTAVGEVIGETLKRPALPLALLLVVLGFLCVQSRLDGRDPKLLVDGEAEPDLDFGPPVRAPTTTA